LPIYISIAGAVGIGIFLMIILDVVHPPAGGNPIMVIIGSASFEYLINPIIFGCILILLIAIIVNKFLLKKITLLKIMHSKYKVNKFKSDTHEEKDDFNFN
jgi:CBS-domain-containing membrane protein